MDEQTTTIVTQAETPEAFLADRVSFWQSFGRFTVGAVAVVVLILLFLWIVIY